MKIFNVLKPGLFTAVQDLGRFGYLKHGIPISGAMDTFSLIAANLLVENNPGDACLETTLIGPELQALSKIQIAITGGATAPKINGNQCHMWQTLEMQEGDVLSFGKMESGCRAYLSMRGGVDVPLILGSRSTYVRGSFGGLEGRHLRISDVIEGFETLPLKTGFFMPDKHVPQFLDEFMVHVILGPQNEMFTDKALETFLSSKYYVTPEADRMGYRLKGSALEHRGKAEIISDALLPGAIQVPKNGMPIIIMRDAQTTGGYPKIAVAITPDVCLLGQAKPSDVIRFEEVSILQAYEKTREYYGLLDNLGSIIIENL
jgi:antagonist of KipI